MPKEELEKRYLSSYIREMLEKQVAEGGRGWSKENGYKNFGGFGDPRWYQKCETVISPDISPRTSVEGSRGKNNCLVQ